MRIGLILAGVVLAGVAGAASAAPAPVMPAKGVYNLSSLDVSQTGTGCTDAQPILAPGSFRYPGPGATGAVAVLAKNIGGYFGFSQIAFPATPAAGITSWKGKLTQVDQPVGTPRTGSFTGTFTYVTAGHFTLALTMTFGSCLQTKHFAVFTTSNTPGAVM